MKIPFFSLLLLMFIDAKEPNIVFILADDLGYMDVSAYAAKEYGVDRSQTFYETPNIDRLVDEGIAFSQFYANPLCSPSRASLLTGKYPHRLGFTTATPISKTYYSAGLEPPEGNHPLDVVKHADKIEIEQAWLNGQTQSAVPAGTDLDAGQDEISLAEMLTGYRSAFLGKWHIGGHGAEGYQPSDQGFEVLAYADAGGSSYFDWRRSWDNKNLPFKTMPQKEWAFGRAGEKTEQTYLTRDLTEKAVNFIEESSEQEKPFFLYFNHFAVHTPIQAEPELIKYFEEKKTKGFNAHTDATYAAMIKALDDSVGDVVEALKKSGEYENTLLIFTSDNGGVKYVDTEEGVPLTNNLPFKGGKGMVYEGGIRVPLIVSHAGKYKEGVWNESVLHTNDFFPTLAAIAKQEFTHQVDGESFADILEQPELERKERELIWHYPFNVIVEDPITGNPVSPHSAIRSNEWKLIWDWHGILRLYNIESDPYEMKDVSKQKPELTEQLHKRLKNWLKENVGKQYFPTLNPDYDPEKCQRAAPFKDLR